MAFEITLNALKVHRLENAVERATATIGASANLFERVGDTETAENLRLALNDLRLARNVLADAGAGIREFPSIARRPAPAEAVTA